MTSTSWICVIKTSALTARDGQLIAMAPIAAQLPIKFDNGASWLTISCHCSGCDVVLGGQEVFGIIARPFRNVAILEAVGVCLKCTLLTRFEYRFHDDMRISGRREDGWQTWRVQPTATAAFARFKKIILGVFHGR
jgi:hypothetical protein